MLKLKLRDLNFNTMQLIVSKYRDTQNMVFHSGFRRSFNQSDLDYIVKNHEVKTPNEMAIEMDYDLYALYRQMKKYELKPLRRYVRKESFSRKSIYKIVDVIEDYANTMSKVELIAARNSVSEYLASKWISKYYFGVKQSNDSIVITLQSKMNL